MNIIQQLEKEQVERLSAGKEIPDFQPGDTVLVNVKVVEGDKARVQAYEGVCIGRSGGGLNENFTVRKISYGEGVERVFPLYSPMIEFDQGRAPRKGAPRQALLPTWVARQEGPHFRGPGRGRTRGRRGSCAKIIGSCTPSHEGAADRPLFHVWRLRCRSHIDWLYKAHGFHSSADCPGRPRAAAVAVFRPADGGAGGTLTGPAKVGPDAGCLQSASPFTLSWTIES